MKVSRETLLRWADWVAELPMAQQRLVMLAMFMPLFALLYVFNANEVISGWLAFLIGAGVIGLSFFLWWRWWLINFEKDADFRHLDAPSYDTLSGKTEVVTRELSDG